MRCLIAIISTITVIVVTRTAIADDRLVELAIAARKVTVGTSCELKETLRGSPAVARSLEHSVTMVGTYDEKAKSFHILKPRDFKNVHSSDAFEGLLDNLIGNHGLLFHIDNKDEAGFLFKIEPKIAGVFLIGTTWTKLEGGVVHGIPIVVQVRPKEMSGE
jgi:hypothetical protein